MPRSSPSLLPSRDGPEGACSFRGNKIRRQHPAEIDRAGTAIYRAPLQWRHRPWHRAIPGRPALCFSITFGGGLNQQSRLRQMNDIAVTTAKPAPTWRGFTIAFSRISSPEPNAFSASERSRNGRGQSPTPRQGACRVPCRRRWLSP